MAKDGALAKLFHPESGADNGAAKAERFFAQP
jgi:hypothetical protein